ncbi:MAG: amidohydrolase [Bacteroidales bacterium]|nr:amidohydrolase [Candidatus Colimorpha merdihippi]
MKRLIFVLFFFSTIAMAQQVIDSHAHMIPQSYLDCLASHDALLDEDFPIPHWDVDEHLLFMDEAGIACSVLTLPAPQPWFEDSEESAKVIRQANEEMAAAKAQHKGRFLFCAALPLPDVDAAVREAIYALDTLHADGVKLASNSCGLYLGDPALDPLMEVLNERGAVIITHPHKPSTNNETLTSVVPLASYEYLAETSRAILNMVGHNVMVRYPQLKVVVPHCGSFLPLAVPRMQSLMPVMNSVGYLQGVDIKQNLQALYYDLAGAATPETIRELLTITSPSHLLYGTDYPYVKAPVLVKNLSSLRANLADIVPDDVDNILYKNAIQLFEK